MTPKERIRRILNREPSDRIGLNDLFADATIDAWRAEGLPCGRHPRDYFGLDFEFFDAAGLAGGAFPPEEKNEKFLCLEFSEPFQRVCGKIGRTEALRALAHSKKELQEMLIVEKDDILDSLKAALEKGASFDGAWVWGDLAYKNGLFFSPSFYKDVLFGLHMEIFGFLNSNGLFVLFHSDGMIAPLVPYLLDAGISAIHPLEEQSGMDIKRLIKDYRDHLAFIGNIDIESFLSAKEGFSRLRRKIDALKCSAFYIYQADYPIMPSVSFDDYRRAIEAVKKAAFY